MACLAAVTDVAPCFSRLSAALASLSRSATKRSHLVDFRLAIIDHQLAEHVAGFDVVALLEVDSANHAVDLGADIDSVQRLRPPPDGQSCVATGAPTAA